MKQGGFTLLEIMISSFILALGLLGLAGMQSTAVKSSIEVQQRTLANSLMLDISERMQLNKEWLSGSGNSYAVDSIVDEVLTKPDCVNDDGSFVNCTGAEIKNNDLYEWKAKFSGDVVTSEDNVNAGLVGADACIESDTTGLNIIVISWYSTIKSVDAAEGEDAGSINFKCGDASESRRQVMTQVYISKA